MSRHGQEIVTALTSNVLLMHIVYLHYETRSQRKTQPICRPLPLFEINFDINLEVSLLFGLHVEFLRLNGLEMRDFDAILFFFRKLLMIKK